MSRRACAAVATVAVIVPALVAMAGTASGSTLTTGLVPVEPCRVLDTRGVGAPPTAGDVLDVTLAGRCGVPADAVAVAVTVTSVDPPTSGWLAVHPAGAEWPGTSTLNVAEGETRANGAVVALGADGGVSVRVDAGGHVLLDVTAAFEVVDESAAGRFVPVTQRRILDTRGGVRPGPDTSVVVPLPVGVPDDATALAVNVTAIESVGPGFVTVHPVGSSRPTTSVLNTDGPGQTRAATAIVPVSPGGLAAYTSAGDHLAVDLAGWFTGPSAPVSNEGLFVPIVPVRLGDSRADAGRLVAGGVREWDPGELLAGDAAAVVANVTMTDVRRPGWVLAHPSRTERPEASSVNASVGETVANLAFVPLSAKGLAVYSVEPTDVVVDVSGWFVGAPVAATGPTPVNDRSGPGRTLLVGDSVLAILRVVPSAAEHLAAFDHALDARECRRTVEASCAYLGARPPTALETVRAAPGPFDTLVLVSGYNDRSAAFAWSVDTMIGAARAAGVERIAWLTLRDDRGQYTVHNIELTAAAARHRDLRLFDWNAHAVGRREWIASDDVHLSREGAHALARFIAGELAALD